MEAFNKATLSMPWTPVVAPAYVHTVDEDLVVFGPARTTWVLASWLNSKYFDSHLGYRALRSSHARRSYDCGIQLRDHSGKHRFRRDDHGTDDRQHKQSCRTWWRRILTFLPVANSPADRVRQIN